MGLCPRLSQLQTASPRVAHLHAPLQLASSSCQYRTTASDQQNRPDQGQPVETPHLEHLPLLGHDLCWERATPVAPIEEAASPKPTVIPSAAPSLRLRSGQALRSG